MGTLLAALGLLLSAPAFAATNTYEIKMDLSVDGKTVFSPRLHVIEGESTSITQDSADSMTYIEVVASHADAGGNKGILMKMSLSHINEDGSRTILANPTIMAKENEPAQIMVGDDDGNISLSVVAKQSL